jgi:hypothetical protein
MHWYGFSDTAQRKDGLTSMITAVNGRITREDCGETEKSHGEEIGKQHLGKGNGNIPDERIACSGGLELKNDEAVKSHSIELKRIRFGVPP